VILCGCQLPNLYEVGFVDQHLNAGQLYIQASSE